ncbi:hypothetical protein RHMOL_Rhmol12G0044900 [Rhododendron molle]|uniref:Uncharacterized protein n=1 Tax=Rhododendron molle TaxID=49168 RepID=A0ACC0LEH9_RHOML|nr:hypothetical protein RHMOL_Rhmol12G0044900 [Rhododendron molle]
MEEWKNKEDWNALELEEVEVQNVELRVKMEEVEAQNAELRVKMGRGRSKEYEFERINGWQVAAGIFFLKI